MAMVKDVYYGKTLRKSYQKHDEILKMPNMLRIQKDSYENFLKTGLQEVFKDVGTITDYTGNLELSFLDFTMKDEPKYGSGTPPTPSPSMCGCSCGTRRPASSRSRRSSWETSR